MAPWAITTLPEPVAPAADFQLPPVTLAPLTMFRLPEDWSRPSARRPRSARVAPETVMPPPPPSGRPRRGWPR